MNSASNSDNSDTPPAGKKLDQVLAELKAEYLAKLPKKLQLLESLTTAGDFAGLEQEYHNLKGTGKTYGFPEISSLSEQLEILSQWQTPDDLDYFTQAISLFHQLNRTYQQGLNAKLSDYPTAQIIFQRVANLSLKATKK